jgi:hypothetical protein
VDTVVHFFNLAVAVESVGCHLPLFLASSRPRIIISIYRTTRKGSHRIVALEAKEAPGVGDRRVAKHRVFVTIRARRARRVGHGDPKLLEQRLVLFQLEGLEKKRSTKR